MVDTHPALNQTFNLDPSHTPWKDRLETLLQTGVRAGADLVEVFLERTDHLGVLAEQERITSMSPSFGMGAGIRVFLDIEMDLLAQTIFPIPAYLKPSTKLWPCSS